MCVCRCVVRIRPAAVLLCSWRVRVAGGARRSPFSALLAQLGECASWASALGRCSRLGQFVRGILMLTRRAHASRVCSLLASACRTSASTPSSLWWACVAGLSVASRPAASHACAGRICRSMASAAGCRRTLSELTSAAPPHARGVLVTLTRLVRTDGRVHQMTAVCAAGETGARRWVLKGAARAPVLCGS